MPLFIDQLGLLFLLAAVLSILAKLFRQPLILAYLATGAIIAYFGFVDVVGKETFEIFSDLGIMFLLFLVGLEINYTSLRLVGKASLTLGLGQIIFTSLAGFAICKILGLALLPAIYISLALTFSSTIIIIKLLSDKKDLNSLYGKLTVGLLLVQDIVAILILVMLSGIQSTGNISAAQILLTLGKSILLFAVVLILGRKLLPYLFDEIAHSQELLFLVSTAWVLLVALIVHKLGFSVEIAGFVAGIGLANSSENYQIANRIRPLRDFFILIFFIILGTSFVGIDYTGLGVPILTLSLFVIIGNPLIMLIIMGLMGFKKRTSFLAGLTVSQISEFSLIMAALGYKVGHIDQQAVAMITAVGIVSIVISSYLIIHGNTIFRLLRDFLSIFERRQPNEIKLPREAKKPIILVGYHRTGQGLAHHLPKNDLIVIDFDPDITRRLEAEGYQHLFGDISDPEIFEQVASYKTRLVISTSPDMEDNLVLISRFRTLRHRPGIVVLADTEAEALTFYEAGADYVLVPHLASGHQLGRLLSNHSSPSQLKKLKTHDIKLLRRQLAG
jgi:Kef-type K+ transport system membrane component KefB